MPTAAMCSTAKYPDPSRIVNNCCRGNRYEIQRVTLTFGAIYTQQTCMYHYIIRAVKHNIHVLCKHLYTLHMYVTRYYTSIYTCITHMYCMYHDIIQAFIHNTHVCTMLIYKHLYTTHQVYTMIIYKHLYTTHMYVPSYYTSIYTQHTCMYHNNIHTFLHDTHVSTIILYKHLYTTHMHVQYNDIIQAFIHNTHVYTTLLAVCGFFGKYPFKTNHLTELHTIFPTQPTAHNIQLTLFCSCANISKEGGDI